MTHVTFGLLAVSAFLESSNMPTTDQAYENRPSERKHITDLFCHCSIITLLFVYCNIIFVTTAEFNGLSSATNRNEILATF